MHNQPAESHSSPNPGERPVLPTHSAFVKRFGEIDRNLVICLMLAFATIAVYWQVGGFGFVNYDDPYYVYENPNVNCGLTWQGIEWALVTNYYDFWHPVMWLAHMLNCELFGLEPGWHHLMNLGFHVVNTLLLFVLLWRLTGAWKRGATVAALFALHPLHVESVAWVSELKDVLSTFFFMLTLLAYARYVQGRSRVEGRESRAGSGGLALDARLWTRDYFLALVFFALGLMTKPMLVTLPFVLLLLDYWPLGRMPVFKLKVSGSPASDTPGLAFRRLILEKLPFFGLAFASCVTTYVGMNVDNRSLLREGIPGGLRLANVPVSYARYLGKLFWPADLTVVYPWPDHWPFGQVAGAVLLLLVISLLVLTRVRPAPYLVFGWLFFLGTLVPVIGIVPTGLHCLCDRYAYIPSIGILVAGVWGIADVSVRWRWRNTLLAGTAALTLLMCGALTWKQLGYWRDSLTLWTHCLAVTRDNPAAQLSFGIALQNAGRTSEALEHYREAIRLEPDYVDANLNLGVALADAGRMQEATNYFARVLRLKPDYASAQVDMGQALLALGDLNGSAPYLAGALRLSPDNVRLLIGMARVLSAQGRSDEVFSYCSKALLLAPDDADAHYVFGLELFKCGRLDEAVSNLDEAARLKPAWADARCHLALALSIKHATGEAIEQYRDALSLNPDLLEALNNLAWLLATQPDEKFRNGAEAVRLAEHAYAESGQFEKAAATAKQACTLASALGQTNLLERDQELLRHYENRQPCRERD